MTSILHAIQRYFKPTNSVEKLFAQLYPSISNPLITAIMQAEISSELADGEQDRRTIITTHNGKFHCDETLATGMLKLLPTYRNAKIVRTRDMDIISRSHCVVDVGAVYNPQDNRFDHHQKSFTSTFAGFESKLSSAGLIYMHFGKSIIAEILQSWSKQVDNDTIDLLYLKMYSDFIYPLDAIDNGFAISETKLRYRISSDLSSRVDYLNFKGGDFGNEILMNSQFRVAMFLTVNEFINKLHSFVYSWLPSRIAILEAFNKRSNPQILELSVYCPWVEHLQAIEKKCNQQGIVKYTIYPSFGEWRVHCVPGEVSFQNRLSLPIEWRGLQEKDLELVTGIPGSTFVHATGFIGGHQTREGAIELAKKALSQTKKKN